MSALPPRLADGSLDLDAALRSVREAAERLRPFVRETPVVYSYTFSQGGGEGLGADVHLKLENLQRTGSFKVRGALNKLLNLPASERARGFVAASAGNHAQGVALAAKLLDASAVIVMPERTPLIKVRRTESYGAEIILFGKSWDEAQAHAASLAEQSGRIRIHPFDDYEIVLGQATVGLELLARLPALEAVLVPIGGGGLAAGVALVTKALAPRVRVIGVQAAQASAMARSLRSGRRVTDPAPRTIADGIRVGTPGELTFEITRELLDDCVTVEEEEISTAVVETLEKSKVVAEPGGVVGIAALLSGRFQPTGPTCVIVSGGNIDLNFLGRLIESGLAHQGFYHPITVRIGDAPGELRVILEILAETGSNIVSIEHKRKGWRVPVGFVDVEIMVELRRPEDGSAIDALLAQRGVHVVGAEGTARDDHRGP